MGTEEKRKQIKIWNVSARKVGRINRNWESGDTKETFIRACQGDKWAQYQVAVGYEKGIETKKDTESAFVWMQRSAMRGLFKAQMDLSMYYTYGVGTEADLEKALFWGKRAAYLGYLPAQKYVVECYRKGIGTEKNIEMACKWLRYMARDLQPDHEN